MEHSDDQVIDPPRDFRQDMRDLVQNISMYAKNVNPDFSVVPQNGIELVTTSGNPDGTVETGYLSSIDANGQESLFYGYRSDNKASPRKETEYTMELLEISADYGNTILVTDYVSTPSKVLDSYERNAQLNFTSYAADKRELSSIPDFPRPIYGENADSVNHLREASNFLYLINYQEFSSKSQLLDSLGNTNYDILILDLFFNDTDALDLNDLEFLKQKKNGSKRIVLCYMSIGEAEDYRYYWSPEWKTNPPEWLRAENPDWPGNYKVQYWNPEWQEILFGSPAAYLDRILESGFDGVYLDIIDGFEYFENN
ncbi:endo alpha-1,4 polygalactosaminidase [Zeaxanthinibacter enoshimensis]|uniref:endo alpha-1,4 polygalactosaminidase n=1 Tax=Zeaxanthinibacter enoshimensis TaxID=392009 RepID=UPI001FB635B7|nr:endo alpha-1,4 polygalactosaminidase [Zeaxanthinibacter enoshimensis]